MGAASEVCPMCGTPVNQSETISSVNTVSSSCDEKKKKPWWMNNMVWYGGILVVTLFAGIFTYLVMSKKGPTEGQNATAAMVESERIVESGATTKEVKKDDAIKARLKDFWTWAWKSEKNLKDFSKYCSADFMNLMAKVDLANEINGYYADGYYTMLDDPSEISNLDVEIYSLSYENERKAIVSGKFFDASGMSKESHNFSSTLVYEKNNWYIDDYSIENWGNGKSERTSMKEYALSFGIDTSPNKSSDKKEVYQNYFKKEILAKCKWYRSKEYGFAFPSYTDDVYETRSDELDAPYEVYFDEMDVHMIFFRTPSWGEDVPYKDGGLGFGHKVKSVTYKNEKGNIYSGMTNKGSFYYLKKQELFSEFVVSGSYRFLVLIYPKDLQDAVKPMIDAVKDW